MELRSSRSRSRTPFVQLTRLEEENISNMVKEETIVRRSYTTRNKTYNSSLSDDVFDSPSTGNHVATRFRNKTSDYSSEEEVSTQNFEESARNGTKSALQVYQEAGEYWNKFPKTDYTYSLNSKDRVEVAPGVICMPNMSRKSLRRSTEPATTSHNTHYSTESYKTRQDYNRDNYQRKTLNFDSNDDEETTNGHVRTSRKHVETSRKHIQTTVSRFFRRILTFFFVIYSSIESGVLWVARTYYKTVSRLFLFDTWLMQKTSTKKYAPLIAVMFLPLAILAGWALWTLINQYFKENLYISDSEIIYSNTAFEKMIQKQNEQIQNLKDELFVMKAQVNGMNTARCCENQMIYLENYMKLFENNINELKLESTQQNHEIDGLKNILSGFSSGPLTNPQIYKMIADAIALYDADKTGLVDYALESSGGQIISTRCTENYHSRTAVVSVLGIPLWYPSNTPRILITPGTVPGDCWAFQNFPGFVVIQLSAQVRISAFSLEHIPERLAPGGRRDSAPKLFTVWGLMTENDHNPWDFGQFEYRLEGPPLQLFPVANNGDAPEFHLIELRVESNHGNVNYTCLYRFRVHGN